MYTYIGIVLIALGGFFSTAHAQQAGQCGAVTSNNVGTCCNAINYNGNKAQCDLYTLSNQNTTGTVGSGTIGTNPTNGQTGQLDQLQGVVGTTPRASSENLRQCSAIRFDSLLDILIWLRCVINAAIIPLLFTLAFLFFLWGMINYIRNANDVKKREETKKFIYWGVIGLTVMVGIWGIVRIVTSTFGLGNTVPQLQTDCLTTDKNNPCK